MKEIKKQIEKLQALPKWEKMLLYAGTVALMGLSIQISGMTGPKGIRASFADAVFSRITLNDVITCADSESI